MVSEGSAELTCHLLLDPEALLEEIGSVGLVKEHQQAGPKMDSVSECTECSDQLASEKLESPHLLGGHHVEDTGIECEECDDDQLPSEKAESPRSPREPQFADTVIKRGKSADQISSEKVESPRSPKVHQIAAKTVSRIRPPVGILLITILYFGEVASACFVSVMYSRSNDNYWMFLTVTFLLVPAVMDQFTLIFVHRDLTSDKPLVLLMHLVLMGPLIR